MIYKKDMLSCDNNCIHKIVCKEIKNWTKYHNEHLELRKESVLFDESPVCPYYKKDGKGIIKTGDEICNDFVSRRINQTTDLEKETVNITEDISDEGLNQLIKWLNDYAN